jgi:hypothetical protein
MPIFKGRIPEKTLETLRGISCQRVLQAFSSTIFSQKDDEFSPKLNPRTTRIYVRSSKFEGELIITGPKFFSQDLDRGGCGAIDFLMFLEALTFRAAVVKLSNVFNV